MRKDKKELNRGMVSGLFSFVDKILQESKKDRKYN